MLTCVPTSKEGRRVCLISGGVFIYAVLIASGLFCLRGYDRFPVGSSLFGLDHGEWVGRTRAFEYQVFRGSWSDYMKHPGLGAVVTTVAVGMKLASAWIAVPQWAGYAVFALMHWLALSVGFGVLAVAVPRRVGLQGVSKVLAIVVLLGCGVWVVMAIPESFGIAAGLLAITFSLIWTTRTGTSRLIWRAILVNGACTVTNALFPVTAALCLSINRQAERDVQGELDSGGSPKRWKRNTGVFLGILLGVMMIVAVFWLLREEIASKIKRGVRSHLAYLNNRLIHDPASAAQYGLWGLIAPAIAPEPYARQSGLSFEPVRWSRFPWVQYPGVVAWLSVLSLGAWQIQHKAFRPYVAMLVVWILFNLVFHNMWGDEFFMYSAHWAWALWVLFCIGLRSLRPKMRILVCIIVLLAQGVGFWRLGVAAWKPSNVSKELEAYERELELFRTDCAKIVNLPKDEFFLFGMGNRRKYGFSKGRLIDLSTGQTVRSWECTDVEICPPQYQVQLLTDHGDVIRIQEDERAVWIIGPGQHLEVLANTEAPVRLPDFTGFRYPLVMRVLHHEVLIGITPAGPVPNPIVYDKPWYRDAAMMAMVLRETGNLDLIKDWILNLRQPYDMNNDIAEPDNLGQVLYLISLVSGKEHPLVKVVLAELERRSACRNGWRFITGKTDGGDHYVFQTKWAKFGLKSLGLPDPFTIPELPDSYSALFWMDFKDSYVLTRDASNPRYFPYLDWACAHFHGKRQAPVGDRSYPLTWEGNAAKARYSAMRLLAPGYAANRIAGPHAWHAAEVMLYFLAKARQDSN